MSHGASVWRRAHVGVVAVAAASAMTVAACGGSDEGGTAASAGGSSGGAFTASSLATAKERLKPYVGKASPIPVTEPLAKQPPPGSKVVFVSCASPECQQFIPGLKDAAAALGVELKVITAGTSAQGVNSAFASAAQMKPLAIIDPALDPSLWRSASKTLKAQGTPVVGHAVVEPPGDNFAATVLASSSLEKLARVQADYVYTHDGNNAKVVYFNTPEFAVFGAMGKAFQAEMAALCKSCKTEILNIPAADLGTKAPARIVSYLQANPDTNWVVTSAPSQVFGLPPALKAAGLKVKIISDGGLAQNYEYIKDGHQVADLSIDYVQDTWLMMDAAVRAGTGQQISAEQQGASPSQQLLEAKDLTFDISKPWVGVSDYQEYFKKLWGKA